MLRLLLFFPIFLFSQEFFSLPDEADYFIHNLNLSIKNSTNDIYIFTENINEYSLIRSLKQHSKKELKVYIFTQSDNKTINKSFTLALLKGVTLYHLKSTEYKVLKGSLVCIDNKTLYLSSSSLGYKSLRNDYSFALKKETLCKDIFKTLMQRAIKIR